MCKFSTWAVFWEIFFFVFLSCTSFNRFSRLISGLTKGWSFGFHRFRKLFRSMEYQLGKNMDILWVDFMMVRRSLFVGHSVGFSVPFFLRSARYRNKSSRIDKEMWCFKMPKLAHSKRSQSHLHIRYRCSTTVMDVRAAPLYRFHYEILVFSVRLSTKTYTLPPCSHSSHILINPVDFIVYCSTNEIRHFNWISLFNFFAPLFSISNFH